MKTFTKIFCYIMIGVMIGYGWAAKSYLPKIQSLEAVLIAYQEYFINYSADEPWAGNVPHKTSKKYETKF